MGMLQFVVVTRDLRGLEVCRFTWRLLVRMKHVETRELSQEATFLWLRSRLHGWEGRAGAGRCSRAGICSSLRQERGLVRSRRSVDRRRMLFLDRTFRNGGIQMVPRYGRITVCRRWRRCCCLWRMQTPRVVHGTAAVRLCISIEGISARGSDAAQRRAGHLDAQGSPLSEPGKKRRRWQERAAGVVDERSYLVRCQLGLPTRATAELVGCLRHSSLCMIRRHAW